MKRATLLPRPKGVLIALIVFNIAYVALTIISSRYELVAPDPIFWISDAAKNFVAYETAYWAYFEDPAHLAFGIMAGQFIWRLLTRYEPDQFSSGARALLFYFVKLATAYGLGFGALCYSFYFTTHFYGLNALSYWFLGNVYAWQLTALIGFSLSLFKRKRPDTSGYAVPAPSYKEHSVFWTNGPKGYF